MFIKQCKTNISKENKLNSKTKCQQKYEIIVIKINIKKKLVLWREFVFINMFTLYN